MNQKETNVIDVTARDAKAWSRAHKPFMTPRIISVKQIKNNPQYFVELSSGYDYMNNSTMHGISVLKYDVNTKEFEASNEDFDKLSKAIFTGRQDAEEYFKQVQKIIASATKIAKWD